MKRGLGINTYGYIWSTPMPECVRRLRGLGYGDFEIVVNPPHLALDQPDRAGRRRLRRLLEYDGIRLRSLNLPSLDVNLASSMREMRSYSVGIFRAAIDLASDYGITHLVTVPGRMNPLIAAPMALREAWMRESLEQLVPYAEARSVGLALENVPIASFPDAVSLAAFVRGFGSTTLSVCYDAANAHFIGESPTEGLRTVRDLVSIVHLSDTTRAAWRHDEIGAGDLPFDGLAEALDGVCFKGTCMLEIVAADVEAAIVRSHRALSARGFAACPVEVTHEPA